MIVEDPQEMARKISAVACPAKDVVCINTEAGWLAWCKRSGLVCPVDQYTHECPLGHSLAAIPPAARWACPAGEGAAAQTS